MTVYDNVNHLYRSDFILDVKTVSVVNGHGVWTPAFNVDKGKVTNLGLLQQEEVKNRKHGPFYAPIGFAFLPFVTSCFGSFGPTATRFLFALANLELLRHDESRQRQGLDPLVDPSALSQYCALCLDILLLALDMLLPRLLLCVFLLCLDYLFLLSQTLPP